MREVIATGKTVEEATEAACQELGLNRDEVSVEILEMPQRKLFKNVPARVKVTADGEEAPPVAAQPQPAPAAATQETAPAAKSEPAQSPAQKTLPEEFRPRETVLPGEPEEEIDLESTPAAKAAAEYLTGIFAAIGVTGIKITALRQGEATLVRVEGEGIADKIETRGETIQALSYLTDRAVNKGVDKKDPAYLRVRLDVAGYRSRREGELIALATRTGQEVARAKRSRTLAPMNPYERLIIHTTIGQMEGVVSESTGVDTERRVVVRSTAPDATEGEDWRPEGGGRDYNRRGPNRNDRNRGGADRGRSDNRGGGSRDRHRSRDNRPPRGADRGGAPRSNTPEREYADKPRDPGAAPVVPKPREAIKDGEDLPLYGKIEL